MNSTVSDPAPDVKWQVWYEDTFDRDCPRRVEASGRGLAQGLTELWARYLRETVQANSSRGFARFNLWWASRSIQIDGDWQGAVRLRRWVFAEVHTHRGYVESGDTRLLFQIAAAHARLVLDGQSSKPILSTAAAAADRQDFEQWLIERSQQV